MLIHSYSSSNAELSGNRRRRVSSECLRSRLSAGQADSPASLGMPLEWLVRDEGAASHESAVEARGTFLRN